MATAAVLPPRDVPTTLNYYTEIGKDAPYAYVEAPPADKPKDNIGLDERPVVIHDARGHEDEFSLDKNGFQFLNYPSVEQAFEDDEAIKAGYYKEVEELLKKVTGGKRVFIFDHTIRRSPVEAGPKARGPALRVHIDQTYNASVERVKYHLPADAERLLASRVRLINVWRPIHHPVAHHPLAVSDWRFLDEKDLVPVRLIYPHRVGGTYSVRHNAAHKWYYLGGQTPDEVTLIKCYDSEEDKARLTPHTSFKDAGSPPDAPHRESIEVRALVFDAE